MGTLRKEFVVRAIAKDLLLREDVVEEVLDRFVDIAVEEIVNKGEFKVHRLFSISTSHYAGYTGGKGVVPAHDRLKIRLSAGIHRLFKPRAKDPALRVDRDSWRTLTSDTTPTAKPRKTALENSSGGDLYNPLLDED